MNINASSAASNNPVMCVAIRSINRGRKGGLLSKHLHAMFSV